MTDFNDITATTNKYILSLIQDNGYKNDPRSRFISRDILIAEDPEIGQNAENLAAVLLGKEPRILNRYYKCGYCLYQWWQEAGKERTCCYKCGKFQSGDGRLIMPLRGLVE